MAEEFNYPYRRFSSDFYANVLVSLLEENEIPYEIVSEPEGAGSVFLGSAAIPGVILMLRNEDVAKVNALEKKETPDAIPEQTTEPDTLNIFWILAGYVMSFTFSPVSIILGLHLMSARKRQPDLSYRPAYVESIRKHGKIIFGAGLFFLIVGFIEMIQMGPRGTILNSVSFILKRFTRY